MEGKGVLLFENAKPIKGSEGGRPEKIYLLNKQHCEFIALLSRNTDPVVKFKSWIVDKFNELKITKVFTPEFQAFGTCMSNGAENINQQLFVMLSSYTDNPLRQEVIIDDDNHRVDLLSSDNTLAIELKTHLITPTHIRRTLFEKNYYHSLKNRFPNFKTLIFSSTVGINEEATEMIKHINPHVIYENIPELANRFIKLSNKKESLTQKFQYLLQAC